MTVEAARQGDRKEWRALVHIISMSFTRPFLLGTVFFRTAPLNVITFRGEGCGWGGLLKINSQVSSIWAKGCILMTVCVFYLT